MRTQSTRIIATAINLLLASALLSAQVITFGAYVPLSGGTMTGTLSVPTILDTTPDITVGTDVTLTSNGTASRVVYKAVVSGTTCTGASGFIAAALNADCVIATLPAKAEITRIVVDNTAGYTCSGTCTGTKTIQVGKTTGGTEYVVAKDVTVTATYGLVNGDLGAALATSATTPILGGDLPSFSATTTLKARFVSGTGNWGNGASTFVNAGSTTIYIETLIFP